MAECVMQHDPEPYVQSGIAGAQVNWYRGGWKFKPRHGYCDDEACYEAGKHKSKEE